MVDVKKYEAITKLHLSEDERSLIEGQIENLFSGFNKLEKVDCSNTIPLVSVVELLNVSREDVASQSVDPKEILKHAHTDNEEYFELPRII